MSLSKGQILVLRDTWQEIAKLGLDTVGLAVLCQLFTDQPQTLDLFYDIVPIEAEITIDGLKKNKRVVVHAIAVATSIAKAVELLENPIELVNHLQQLGRIHKMRKVDSQYFDLMGPILLKVVKAVLGNKGTDEVMEAWGIAYEAIKMGIVKKL